MPLVRRPTKVIPFKKKLMIKGGIIVSNLPMEHPEWSSIPVPSAVKNGRYVFSKVDS